MNKEELAENKGTGTPVSDNSEMANWQGPAEMFVESCSSLARGGLTSKEEDPASRPGSSGLCSPDYGDSL